MFKKNRSSILDHRKKNRNKKVKAVIQAAIIVGVGLLLLFALVEFKKYEEPDKTLWTNRDGFIALSYFGIDRNGTPKRISQKEIDKQLSALHSQGYQTVSQQDVIDFYTQGKALPEKALFLSFEDGRNDSSIFVYPSLKKYNFKATFLSYANKMGNGGGKFLQPKEMLEMVKGGFWELGTNGYRLAYINTFDDEGNYIGVRDENELRNKEHMEYYNHYLMDFIRDENMVPIENRAAMEKRIEEDYRLMREIYTEKLGFVPEVYMIMHANALHGAANRLISNANDEQIKDTFNIHFNLEGNMYNKKDENLINLTRVQPAPYWYTNHLLMKIQKDTAEKMEFVLGDKKRAEMWRQLDGVAEFLDNRIVLTSPPAKEGRLYLLNSTGYEDVTITANLSGNIVGKQSIYLRYDEEKNTFVRVILENNKVIVEEKALGKGVRQLGNYKLSDIEQNIEDITFDKATVYTHEQTMAGARTPEDEYQINSKHTRKFEIGVQGNKLSANVDGEYLFADQEIDRSLAKGGIGLGASYHKKNNKDDIYDGVFDDIIVKSIEKNDDEKIVFSNTLNGFQKVVGTLKKSINNTANWVIDTF